MERPELLVEASNITREYRLPNGANLHAVRDVNMAVAPGEFVLVSGRSGSGKTSLLFLLGLLDLPTAGAYRVLGQDVIGKPEDELARIRGGVFGFVYQNFYLLPNRTALENVAAPLEYAPEAEVATGLRRAAELLAELGIRDRSDHTPAQLSGGEQQRVAIARALIREPKLILADEPTGSLDTKTARELAVLLRRLSTERGAAVVIVSHDVALFSSLVDTHYGMDDGTLTLEHRVRED